MPILTMPTVSTVKKRDDYREQRPLSTDQLSEQRRLYTAPRPSATNVMRAILQGASNNPNATAAARHRVKSKADMNLKNRQDQMRNQFVQAVSVIDEKDRELEALDHKMMRQYEREKLLGNYQKPHVMGSKRNVSPEDYRKPYFMGSKRNVPPEGYRKPHVMGSKGNVPDSGTPYYTTIQNLNNLDVPEFNPTTSADPQDIRSALYQNEGGFVGRGMSMLDDIAFRKAGGDRFVTDEINRVGKNLQEEKQSLSNDLSRRTKNYNERLADSKRRAKEIMDELIARENMRKAREANEAPKIPEQSVPSTPEPPQSQRPVPIMNPPIVPTERISKKTPKKPKDFFEPFGAVLQNNALSRLGRKIGRILGI